MYAVIVLLYAQTSGESLLRALSSAFRENILILGFPTLFTATVSEVLAGWACSCWSCHLAKGRGQCLSFCFMDGGVEVRD